MNTALIHSADISLFQKHLRLELEAIRASAGISTSGSSRGTPLI